MKITGTKSKYEVGDVIVVFLAGRKIKSIVVEVLTDEVYYNYVIENDEFGIVSISHYDILGLAKITDNEPKDNDGWIMVSDYEPLVKTNIFFVTTNGEIHLGYRSALDNQYNNHFDSTTYMREQVIKWQYVKFPKI